MNISRNKAIDTAQLRQELHGMNLSGIVTERNNSGIYYRVQALKGLCREVDGFSIDIHSLREIEMRN
ncbi:MAG: hypothetical protein LBK96_04315 [Prevotellaceae bacterium]|jgi:hypothetical protein|nr:hypothetical protein [Prevotellaceae bacterium]